MRKGNLWHTELLQADSFKGQENRGVTVLGCTFQQPLPLHRGLEQQQLADAFGPLLHSLTQTPNGTL